MTPIPPSYQPDPSSYEEFDFSNPISELNSDSTESSPTYSIHSPDPSVSTPHSPVSAEIQPLPPRKSSRAHLPPVWMKDFVTTNNASAISTLVNTDISFLFHCFLSTLTSTSDPVSFKTVVQKPEWIDAMNQELDALELNNTWEVTKLPVDCHAIGCKWIYKTKFLPDRSIDKHKARLVILGCQQKYCIDFAEIFAPVTKLTTVRTLLAVAAMENWFTCQMDVSNAFLHGDLSEVVYMKMPPGYTHFNCRITVTSVSNSSTILVCKLKKSLYGLKHKARNWFAKLSSTLLRMQYVQSKTDYSLFIHHTSTVITLVLVYVDDLLIAGNCSNSINTLKSLMSQTFHMKDVGPLTYFLGLEIHRDAAGIIMCQKKYTCDILHKYGLSTAKPVLLPMDPHVKLTAGEGELLSDPALYQRLIGKLIYLTITRPDIAYTVQLLSQFIQQPTSTHFQAAKRLLRYLIGTSSQGILLASSSAAQLTAYCDSD
ncbi:hypothetical protein AgCh_031421 [Apium graveolens]